MSENLEQNLNDNVGEQVLEQNLNENFSQSARENLSENTANKNSYENLRKSEQSPENLDKNPSEESSSAEILSQATSKCKAQNLFKKAFELSLQGVADALIYAGKAGVWLLNASNCLKVELNEVEFAPIYLAKKQSFGTFCTEYFYEARAKFNGFLYDFKIGAANGEILNLKIKSQI